LRLAEAEASVHRTPIESVHFHEVGAVDSIVDIVASAACIEFVGAEVLVSTLPMGRGFIQCQHGRIPLPAPATVGCLKGLETYDGLLPIEFVTPTAAAVLGAIAKGSSGWPDISPVGVGWGAGTRTIPDRPNALRVVLGEPSNLTRPLDDEEHFVIEANLDDATGEMIGHWMQILIASGALDVWSAPVTMKKGRPGIVLSVLAQKVDLERISAMVLRETTTLGVRRYGVSRATRPRRVVEVSTRYGLIPVKISEGPFGPPQIKPEFEVCARLATENEVPVRIVLAEALASTRSLQEI
jgi:uncharacterized protein (TIGR00299 family) protein